MSRQSKCKCYYCVQRRRGGYYGTVDIYSDEFLDELKMDLLFPDFDESYTETSEWLDGGNLFTSWQTEDIKRTFVEICEGFPVREVRYERVSPTLFTRKPWTMVIASNKVNEYER